MSLAVRGGKGTEILTNPAVQNDRKIWIKNSHRC